MSIASDFSGLRSYAPQAGGAALGGVMGQLGDAMSAPRRYLWSQLGLPEEGNKAVSSVLHSLTGNDYDSENPLMRALGFAAEMAGDPLTYSGMLGGKTAQVLGGGLRNVAEHRAMLGATQKELSGLGSIAESAGSAAKQEQAMRELMMAKQHAPNPLESLMTEAGHPHHLESTYRPEVMNELPDILSGKFGQNRVFNRVDPELAKTVEELSLGMRTPEGGLRMTGADTVPSFAKGRGGKLFAEGNLPDTSGLLPPLEFGSYGAPGKLTPHQEYLAMRGESMGPLRNSAMERLPDKPYPTLSHALGAEQATQLADLAPGAFAPGAKRHLVDIPVDQAQAHAAAMMEESRRRLEDLQSGKHLSILDRFLMKRGY